MQIKPNLTLLDRYIRLTGGLILLASAAGGRKRSLSRYALAGIGAMKVAEAVTGWCPLVQLAQATAEAIQGDEAKETPRETKARSPMKLEEMGRRREGSRRPHRDSEEVHHAKGGSDEHHTARSRDARSGERHDAGPSEEESAEWKADEARHSSKEDAKVQEGINEVYQ
ncbi:DUF2892 domain-containing protein [Alicyclobacillus sp.]|uniref:YgaP family membrane protein n=1 Tax=Alicyclobacillus sp. TaxID=61169 RepID=UPI0025B9ED19|nr:DUF2892 domain-containing protein [Alicyclobacillus sp.]MCL6515351.1 DUF2892 domain-containing protein [Alicyclobacillus sp.]